ncbi:hypothetical protein DIPPA_11752 [Diplonema papillatum]|nr:hypothetical protein DIPPA_11752 [Diplonema papillatum]
MLRVVVLALGVGGAASATPTTIQMLDATTGVDKGLGMGTVVDGAQVWTDAAESRFSQVPNEVEDILLLKTPTRITADQDAVYTCGDVNQGACLAYVYMYNCPTCEFQEGDLADVMAAQGWEALRCAPRFFAVAGGMEHRFQAYRKELLAGQVESVAFTEAATDFVAFAIDPDVIDCTNRPSEMSCEMDAKCVWLPRQHCAANICRSAKFAGPLQVYPKCASHCISVDVVMPPTTP